MLLIVFFFFLLPHYLVLFCLHTFCLAKPITSLCWYLVVLGYLPALHLIFTSYVHAFMYIWMNGIFRSPL